MSDHRMAATAKRMLRYAQEHRRPEDPNQIPTTCEGSIGRRLRCQFARMNRDSNRALEHFWREQIDHYMNRGTG